MSKQMFSRREFIRLSALAATGTVLAACGATPTATPVPPTATKPAPTAAPVPPTATKAPAAATAAPAAPTAAPAAPTATKAPAAPTAAPAAKYKEAPMLAKLVAEGKLPPVDQRIGQEPLVLKPTNETGKYGGTIRTFMVNAEDRSAVFNFCLFDAVIDVPRDVKAFGKLQPHDGWIPILIKAWEWNANDTQLKLHMRKGMKWSDNTDFTSDDLLFYYNDVQLFKDITKTTPSDLLVGGKEIKVSALDKYTLVFDFPAPNPAFLFSLRNAWWLTQQQKAYMSQFHPKYNTKATVDDYNKVQNDWYDQKKPRVCPWFVESSTPEGITCVRNPFFCAVDTEGNQLPYADKVTFPMVGTTDNAILKTIAGEIDVAERNMQQIDQLPILKENEAKGKFKVLYWGGAFFGTGNTLHFRYHLQDAAYAELKQMMNKRDFRYALSIAIDRKDINDAIYLGTGRPSMYIMNSTSPYWDDEMAKIVAPIYDVAKAKQLLDGLDLKDRNGDGLREYPSGKNVTIIVDVASELKPHQMSGEMIVRYWKAIGIDARLNTTARATVTANQTQQKSHAHVWGPGNADIPSFRPGEEILAPAFLRQAAYRVANEPLPEGFDKVNDLVDKILVSGNFAETQKMYKDLAKLRIDLACDIHTVADLPYMVIRSNRMGNMPDKGSGMLNLDIERKEQFYIKE